MTAEYYFIDDISFVGLLDNSKNVVNDVRSLVHLAEKIIEEGHTICVPDSIDSITIKNGMLFNELYDVDFSQSDKLGSLDRDTLFSLFSLKRRLNSIPSQKPIPASLFDSKSSLIRKQSISGTAEIIVRTNENNEECCALLVLKSKVSARGEHYLHSDKKLTNKVFVLRSIDDLLDYVRWVIKNFSKCENDFFTVWDRAFPKLLKSKTLAFNGFGGNYNRLYEEVLKHLIFLNDQYELLCAECNNDFPSTKRKAKSIYGIDYSNESANTRNSTSKMNKRSANFLGKEVICELHTKISPTKNRIHFHPPIDNFGENKILVGIFVDHLPT